jgi:hypothetical protein
LPLSSSQSCLVGIDVPVAYKKLSEECDLLGSGAGALDDDRVAFELHVQVAQAKTDQVGFLCKVPTKVAPRILR